MIILINSLISLNVNLIVIQSNLKIEAIEAFNVLKIATIQKNISFIVFLINLNKSQNNILRLHLFSLLSIIPFKFRYNIKQKLFDCSVSVPATKGYK